MPYIIGEQPCEYSKNAVHYHFLNELQLFQLSRFCTYYRYYFMDLDFSDKESMLLVSVMKCSKLKQIRHYCLNCYNKNKYTFICKRTIQTLDFNKYPYIYYMYDEEHIVIFIYNSFLQIFLWYI